MLEYKNDLWSECLRYAVCYKPFQNNDLNCYIMILYNYLSPYQKDTGQCCISKLTQFSGYLTGCTASTTGS